MAKVYTPVRGYTGVVAGVAFADGVGEVSDEQVGALHYFQRHGYQVGGSKPEGDGALPVSVGEGGRVQSVHDAPEIPEDVRDADSVDALPENASIAEMKAYATAHTIDLGDAKSAKDIRAAIENAANPEGI